MKKFKDIMSYPVIVILWFFAFIVAIYYRAYLNENSYPVNDWWHNVYTYESIFPALNVQDNQQHEYLGVYPIIEKKKKMRTPKLKQGGFKPQ